MILEFQRISGCNALQTASETLAEIAIPLKTMASRINFLIDNGEGDQDVD